MQTLRRITTGQPATLAMTWYPQDSEAPADPDGQACSASVMHVNGTVVLPSSAAVAAGVGQYTITLPPQSVPADMIVTWAATFGGVDSTYTTYVTVVGAHFADLAEIRALDGLGDTDAYPTAMLVEKRDQAETLFELATGVFWTPHYCRDLLDGDPNYRRALQSSIADMLDYIPMKRLVLTQRYPRQLLTVSFAGVPVDDLTQYLVYRTGEVEASLGSAAFPRGIENIIIEYVAGADAPPSDLAMVFKRYVRHLVLDTNSQIPDRATSVTTEFGTFSIGQAKAWDKPTGLDYVDAVLQRYGLRVPAFA